METPYAKLDVGSYLIMADMLHVHKKPRNYDIYKRKVLTLSFVCTRTIY